MLKQNLMYISISFVIIANDSGNVVININNK